MVNEVSREGYQLVEEKCGRTMARILLWSVVLATITAAIGVVAWGGHNAYIYVGAPALALVKRWQPAAPFGLQVAVSMGASFATLVAALSLTSWWLRRFLRQMAPHLDRHIDRLHARIGVVQCESAGVASTNAALRSLDTRLAHLESRTDPRARSQTEIMQDLLRSSVPPIESVDDVLVRDRHD